MTVNTVHPELRDHTQSAFVPHVAPLDTGSWCLSLLLSMFDMRAEARQIQHDFANPNGQLDLLGLVKAARRYELKAKAVTATVKQLAKLPLPAIVQYNDGSFAVLARLTAEQVLVQQPEQPPQQLTTATFETLYSGKLVLLARCASKTATELKFGLCWFLPVMLKYKRLFGEVLLASCCLQAFGLITPLFFQVIIDKVLVHQGITTLDVLLVGLIGLTVFEVILGFLRTYIFSHTTSRVDVQLGSQLFRHLLALPMTYFDQRPTGQTVARVSELDTIRDFLTSSALTVVIDLFFTLVFFWVMWLFSPTLTLIVLASIPFYLLLSLSITPELRRRVEERFYRSATNQAFLVENIAGAETLKAMAVEPQMRNRWDENLAAYVKASFHTIVLGAFGSQMVMLINKVTMAIILWVGATQVMAHELTVGQLVAFNMLAGQVSQPLIRLAQLWQEFQQFRISIQRLGDILNTQTEFTAASAPENLPPIQGSITLQDVTFRYRANEAEILRQVSLRINHGQTVGLVGRSGSGKSTITKLVQRLHVPEQGRVLIDGIDISLMDPAWLRRQIGVVLQDNILFNRTVRDNIALSNPAMTMNEVIHHAKLAGAHEFILRLPAGYDTLLEERGANLSGGQRQRIAIARALAINPRILILDEATAALDYDSERRLQNNLKQLAQGRTVLIVAHRLSTIRHADQILVLEQGQVVEQGTHTELVRQNGIYADLNRQDQGDHHD